MPTWKRLALDVPGAAHLEAPIWKSKRAPPDPTTKTKVLALEKKSWRNNFVNVLRPLAPAPVTAMLPAVGSALRPYQVRLHAHPLQPGPLIAVAPAVEAAAETADTVEGVVTRGRVNHERMRRPKSAGRGAEAKTFVVEIGTTTTTMTMSVLVNDAVVEATEGTMLQLPTIIGPVRHHPPAALTAIDTTRITTTDATTAQVIAIAVTLDEAAATKTMLAAPQEGVEAATTALPFLADRVVALLAQKSMTTKSVPSFAVSSRRAWGNEISASSSKTTSETVLFKMCASSWTV